MGFGTSATEIIFFIGSVLVALSISGVLGITSVHLASGIQDKGNIIKNRFDTDFAIINNPDNIPVSDGYYVFYIKNTGYNNFYFSSDTVSVIIDGILISPSNLSFSSADKVSLDRSEVGEILVNSTLSSGYHTLKVVVYNGIYRKIIFQV